MKMKNSSSKSLSKFGKTIITFDSSLMVLSLLLLIFDQLVASQTMNKDLFTIDKLMEYTELVTCFGKMSEDFKACTTKGAEKAKSYMKNIEFSSEWSKRLKCCGTWKLRDCWMKAAREKCTGQQQNMVYNLPKLMMPGLMDECIDYLPESGKCSLPIWLIVLVVSLAIFIFLTCCCLFYYCFRRMGRSRRLHNRKYLNNKKTYQNGTLTILNNSKINGAIEPPKNSHINNRVPMILEAVDSEESKALTNKNDQVTKKNEQSQSSTNSSPTLSFENIIVPPVQE